MDLQLTGKRAVITGGSRGIGLAIARSLAAEGVDLALVARDQETLDAAAASLAHHGVRVITVPTDTGDDQAVRDMVARVVAELGGVDILVNSAARVAGGPSPRYEELTDEELRADLEIKLLGYLRTARAAAPHMAAQGWGRIINVSGLAARQAGSISTSVRNAAVVALSKNLADELGGSGVNVNVVHPGMTDTERIPALVASIAEQRGIDEDQVLAGFSQNVAIGRMVTGDEIGDVVVFLASPRSVAITGEAISVGGGQLGPINY